MTARFDKLTLIDVANMRTSHLRGDNKCSWNYISEELNLTASELKAIRKSTSYRIVAGEVLANLNADIDVASTFGVEKHLANSIVKHAENAKAETEARKTEVETTIDTTDEVVEDTTSTTEETTAMTKPVATTEALATRLENLKARYTEAFGTDLDGNEVETPEVSTPEVEDKEKKQFKVFYTSTLDVEDELENSDLITIEAESISEAKKQVLRKARKANIVDADDKFSNEWKNFSNENGRYFLRPLALGARGFTGGLCLYLMS